MLSFAYVPDLWKHFSPFLPGFVESSEGANQKSRDTKGRFAEIWEGKSAKALRAERRRAHGWNMGKHTYPPTNM